MALVAGVDSSTQSCKIVIRDAESGALVRTGAARHPDGTEVDPAAWWTAFTEAVDAAGGLDGVEALAVGGQQHGMVCLDADGEVIRPALLWNDTRSAQAARDLIDELGDGDADAGRRAWVEAVGSSPVASFTLTKLRWLADNEPENAARIAAVALPHDWLTWKISGAESLDTLVTDRSDASGTIYFDAESNEYRRDLLALGLRRSEAEVQSIVLPRVLAPHESAGRGSEKLGYGGFVLGPGCGDNAGAALGLALTPGQTSLSLGTSGVVASVSPTAVRDDTGAVAGFADATGNFLPLTTTLNASRILDAAAKVLGVDYDELGRLALAAEPGAGGLVHIPYLEGERTPNLPSATGALFGMTLTSLTRENYARAAVEGMLCLMGYGADAMRALGVPVERIAMIGGSTRSKAVCGIAPAVLGVPVDVPEPGEYVADGAARQAAWVLSGADDAPDWSAESTRTYEAEPTPQVRDEWNHWAGNIHDAFSE